MNRDHSVIFEIASRYCILDSFVDYDGYSISSKGFLPTVVDIMSSELNSPIQVQCCKEHYCIGTWNLRSMNQGKLEVVKQEMARVNINSLGISEVKWTGIGQFNSGQFNSDDHYLYFSGQESLRRNGVAIIVNKRV